MSTDIETYDDWIERVGTFRVEHSELPTEDQDRLLLKTFKINRATLREMDGMSDLLSVVDNNKI